MPGTDHPDFRRAMRDAGLVPPARLWDDGKRHRCQVEGKKANNKSGSYNITADGRFGGYKNWSTGSEWQQWRADKAPDLTPAQREEILRVGREATAARIAEEKRLRELARLKADMMWRSAAEGPHPYLDRKGVCSNGSRVLGDLLLVPICDWAGTMHSLQTITPAGEKKFLHGGRFKGGFHWIRIGQQTGPVVYVCEGFATGSTIHAATTGKPVVVAFSCGNLLPVCEVLRHQLPKARIVVCADNDHLTDGTPGLTKATEAAKAVRGRLAVPTGMSGTDFNDLQMDRGIMEVGRQLSVTKIPLTVVLNVEIGGAH